MQTYNKSENHDTKIQNSSDQCKGCFSEEEIDSCTKGGFSKPDREILHAVAKTTSMAIESIKDLLSGMDECHCEGILKCQMECYKVIYRAVTKGLEDIEEDVDKVGGMQKMMLWTSTKWDMMMDDSNSNIAQLLIRGTAMGVCEVGKAMNDFKSVSGNSAVCIGDKTMHLMSEFVDQLKKRL